MATDSARGKTVLPFVPDRRLLNPHFESYKLSFASTSPSSLRSVSEVPLPSDAGPGRTIRVSGVSLPDADGSAGARTREPGWKEIRSKAGWNHLSHGPPTVDGDAGSATWVTEDGSVWMASIPQTVGAGGISTGRRVGIQKLFSLPATGPFANPELDLPEYPRIINVPGPNLIEHQIPWVVSDGHGRLFAVSVDGRPTTEGSVALTSRFHGVFELPSEAPPTGSIDERTGRTPERFLQPFRLHRLDRVTDTQCLAILSTTIFPSPSSSNQTPEPGLSSGGLGHSLSSRFVPASNFANVPSDAAATASARSTRIADPHPSKPVFEILLARIPTTVFCFPGVLPSEPFQSPASPIEIVARLRGDDLPPAVLFQNDPTLGLFRWWIGAPSTYRSVSPPSTEQSSTSNIEAEVEVGSADDSVAPAPLPRPNYTWTQTSDSLTLVFPLPTHIPSSLKSAYSNKLPADELVPLTKDDLKVTVSTNHLTVLVGSADPASGQRADAQLPRLTHQKLWDAVMPGESVWTVDRTVVLPSSTVVESGMFTDSDHTEGEERLTLTVDLVKRNEGTRWSHVFDGNSEGGPHVNVPETLTEEQREEIARSLDKYTTDLLEDQEEIEEIPRVGGQGLGNRFSARQKVPGPGADNDAGGRFVPSRISIIDDEMDEEIDGVGAGVGYMEEDDEDEDGGIGDVKAKKTGITVAPTSSNGLIWTRLDLANRDGAVSVNVRAINESFPVEVVSTPLPTTTHLSQESVIIKHTLDGAVFLPPTPASATGDCAWNHVSTFPALSYVLASKRDVRLVYHVDDRIVLAFELGQPASIYSSSNSSTSQGTGNLYLYYNAPTGSKEMYARQEVVRLTGSDQGTKWRGLLVGVVGLPESDGKVSIVCLFENELVTLHSWLDVGS